jgi:hypothetical protein
LPKRVKRRNWPIRATSLHGVAGAVVLAACRSRRLAREPRQEPSGWRRCRRPGSAQRRCTGMPNRPETCSRTRPIRFTLDRRPTCSRARIALYTVLLAQPAASAIASYRGEAGPQGPRPAGHWDPFGRFTPWEGFARIIFSADGGTDGKRLDSTAGGAYVVAFTSAALRELTRRIR